MRTTPLVLVASVALVVAACSSGGSDEGPPPLTVAKAACGASDKPETALQGQVPAALRQAGFNGFNCNLELVGQSRGDGASWQATQFKDKAGRTCAYHGTSNATANRTHMGVPVIDITDAARPVPTAYLTTTAMIDPWESLKVNERRQMLGAVNARNGRGGPEVDFYDLSGDCRNPQLLSSVAVGKADGSTGVVASVIGHEGAWAPDGLTYYAGDTTNAQYYAVDVTNATQPKLLGTWKHGIAGGGIHGFSISDDGSRGYFVSTGSGGSFTGPPENPTDAAIPTRNGLVIFDLTDFQTRKANPTAKEIGRVLWKDGSVAQHTIPVKIGGKPHVIFVDEGGSGGVTSFAQFDAACSANMAPFPMARIIDIADEKAPKVVSKVMLETHDPANCAKVRPDLAGLAVFTYGSHYCSVDNRQNATTLACGYFNSGIRVFDIRNPERPREIAYFNPAGVKTQSPGSNHSVARGFIVGGPDWCASQLHLDAARGTLWTACHDNGLVMLKFTNGVWPFPESTTPPGMQN
jgi:hypothetical protein